MRLNKSYSILEVGQRLTQTRGYNAFSYADISEQVKIRKASIHYYFPSKADLGRKLVIRYRREMRRQLQAIEQATACPWERLSQVLRLYREGLTADGLCLCTVLSAEFLTLPDAVQSQVREFYSELESWVGQVISAGQATGCFRVDSSPEMMAQSWLASLQGTQMRCRLAADRIGQWDAIAPHLLGQLAAA
ncbi:MAG: TetR/AcrR family transcriptional regulator [Cyanobacteria bacterium Co-bin8]|nr:TetR/AcrR family transcriptional regulator [Cyanobacteria bacterium Co-bin8]